MPSRKVQALTLIGRITQQALEEEAAALGRLHARMRELAAEKAALRADLQAQAEVRSLEASAYLPGYIRAVRGEEGRIDAELVKLAEEAQALEEALRARFLEKKRTEKVLDDATAAEAAEAARAEARALDDLAVMRHARGRPGPG